MSKKSKIEEYEAVNMTELMKGDTIMLDITPSGPKMGTVTNVETVVIPSKTTGSGTFQSSFTETTISAISDSGSPYCMTETVVQKITRNMK